MSEAGCVVQLRDLRKTIGSLEILGGVTLAVQRNEIITLMGPSGCGKTTLLRIVSGLLEADNQLAVKVALPGEEIGFVLQKLFVFPWLTVRQNVAFGLRLQKVNCDSRVGTMLSQLGLSSFEHFYPQQLSGGMLQRVALGRTMVLRPRLLLLDEPFTGLDYQRKRELYQLLLGLRDTFDTTFIVVGHDVEDAVSISDRVIVLSDRPASVLKVFENQSRKARAGEYSVSRELIRLLEGDGGE